MATHSPHSQSHTSTTQAQGSFGRSFDRSFVQVIFVQPLCCRNSDCSSFVHTDYSSFIGSFIITIHHSSFVHTYYSSFIGSFIVTIHCSSFVHTTIHRSSFVHTDYTSFIGSFIVTIHHSSGRSSYYSSLLFTDHPITQIFNCSSIMLSSSPTCQTNISVIRTPVTMIFLLGRTSHLVTHPRFLQVEHAYLWDFFDPGFQKERQTMFVWIHRQSCITWPKIPQPTRTRIPQHSSHLGPALVLSHVT
jgi:hypothetical protein